jgi:hypothetical protein
MAQSCTAQTQTMQHQNSGALAQEIQRLVDLGVHSYDDLVVLLDSPAPNLHRLPAGCWDSQAEALCFETGRCPPQQLQGTIRSLQE